MDQITTDNIGTIKVILVGDLGVGKTNLLSRFLNGKVPEQQDPTIGFEFTSKTVQLDGDTPVKVQFWDTAGQDKFRHITNMHFNRAGGGLVVYDITNVESFNSCVQWIKDLKDKADGEVVVVLVGNKTDLIDSNPQKRQVSYEEGQTLANQNGAKFIECSSLSGHNVKECFITMIQGIMIG